MTVELFMAFAWICPNCGDRNYADGVTVEDPDMKADMAEADGLGEGEFVAAPASVSCRCGATFDVEHDCNG